MKDIEVKEKLNEFLKCKNDFEYYCKKYVIMELPGRNEIMKPYDKQLELIRFLQKEKHVIVLKSRQIGISTITQVYVSWLCIFYRNVVFGIISKDGPEATSFARKIVSILQNIPSWFGVKFIKKSEQSFILSNGCQCYASPVTKIPSKTLRGKSITFLISDETAFTNDIEEAWTSIVPALSTNHKMARDAGVPYGTIILSTPNKTQGIGKFFYDKYTKSVRNESILKYFEIYWKEIPQLANDPSWYSDQCALLDYDQNKIDQELELKFISTEGNFFSPEICSILQENARNRKPILIQKIHGGEFWKFEEFIPSNFYIMGIDTATSFGSDKSTIEIFNYETLDQVWEYQGKCEILDFILVIQFAFACYKNCHVVIENNSCANQVVETLKRTEVYNHMYKEKKGTRIIPGLSTNAKSRPLMIDALYSYVSQYPDLVKSKRLALELTGLIDKKGKVEADKGIHDDLAMATSMAFYVRKFDPPLGMELKKNINYNDDFSLAYKLNEIDENNPTDIFEGSIFKM